MAPAIPPIFWQSYLNVPPAKVFLTLSTAAGWDGWFTHGATLEARVGGELRLRWQGAAAARHRVTVWGTGHETMEVVCAVVAVDLDRRFAFEWRTAPHPTTVTFELIARGPGTLVSVTETGYLESDLGVTGELGAKLARSPLAMCASGWGEALTLLKLYLEHGVTYGQVPPA